MRNGSGDEYAIVFSAAGAYIRGFDHEAVMSPYAVTACLWRETGGAEWRVGEIDYPAGVADPDVVRAVEPGGLAGGPRGDRPSHRAMTGSEPLLRALTGVRNVVPGR